jgi:ATP-dependent Zn protease
MGMNEEQDLFEKTFDELWKKEEYNFGTTDEDGWHNFDDYTDYPFAIEEMSTLANEYQKLKKQLQAYKDKEDKIKRLLLATDVHTTQDILQILNEGSDE